MKPNEPIYCRSCHGEMDAGVCPNGCEETDAELIKLPERVSMDPGEAFYKGPITTKRKEYGGCLHRRVEVDEEHRTVECRDCKKTLDPIQVLLNFRMIWIEIQNARSHLKSEQEKYDRAKARRASKRK